MTGEILLVLLFAAVLLLVCWMLAEYWIGIRSGGMNGESGKLRAGSRTAFALLQFWKKVDHVKEIPEDTLKMEMERADLGIPGKEERKGKR